MLQLHLCTVYNEYTPKKGAKRMRTKQSAFRFDDETIQMLDDLCRIYGFNRTQFLVLKIKQEHDVLQGNPKMRKMLEALRDCTNIISKATDTSIAVDTLQMAIDELDKPTDKI